MKQIFAGTGTLVTLALRRDRLKLSLWVMALGLILFATTAGAVSVYNEPSEQTTYATTAIGNMGLFFNGSLDSPRIESIAITETVTFISMFVALMSTMLVMRHTRQNEENGRAELIGAAGVGRYAPLAAALLVAIMANLAIGALETITLLAQGFAAEGSVLAGLALALMGCVFAAIGAVAAQLTATARAGNGLAAASIGGFFLVRAIGDMQGKVDFATLSSQSGWLSWLSPIGLARATQPFAGNRWWVIGILAGLFGAILAIAVALARKRDLGAGLLGTRSGRSAARPGLLSNLGLAWRLQRGLLVGWACGLGVLALTLGAVTEEVKKFTSASGEIAEVIATLGNSQNLVDGYISFSLMLFGIAAAAYGIQAFLRTKSEESQGHLEELIATATSRTGWLLSHILVVTLGAGLLLFLCGALAGMAYGLTAPVEFWPTIAKLATATLAYLPAVLIFIGIGAVVFGAAPRWALALPWLLFAASYAVTQFKQLLNLPDWVANVSPFNHVPMLPAESFSLPPLLVMSALAAGFLLLGLVAFTQRDVQTA